MIQILGYWYSNGKRSLYHPHEKLIGKEELDEYIDHLKLEHHAHEVYVTYKEL